MTTPQDLVAEVPLWYHTLELGPGLVTPGWFDLRGMSGGLPWPDVEGRRCLDIATWDGFFAFELERRGAAGVVATDIASHDDWDWLPRDLAGPATMREVAGAKGRGFEIARQLLGSSVERRLVNVYDLASGLSGDYDVVVMGSLLLHLRDPFGALEAIRDVCRESFMSIEAVDDVTSVLHPRRPVVFLEGDRGRWAIPNAAAHVRMLEVAGFDVEEQVLLDEPLGPGHPDRDAPPSSFRDRVTRLARRVRFGGPGVPVSAVRCRPATARLDTPTTS